MPPDSAVAIHAENTKAERILIVLKPFVNRPCSMTRRGGTDSLTMQRSPTVDVVNGEELNMRFTTASALSATVGGKGSSFKCYLARLGLLLKFSLVLLSPGNAYRLIALLMGSGIRLVIGPAFFLVRLIVQKACLAVLMIVGKTSFSCACTGLWGIFIFVRHKESCSISGVRNLRWSIA